MKIAVNTKIKNILTGSFAIYERNGKKSDLQLKDMAAEALCGVYPDEQHLGGREKADRFDLACRIVSANKDVEMSVEEVAKLKDLIGKAYAPHYVGPAWQILDTPIISKEKKD